MATKYIVNNVTGQTINGQQVQPYKVYTALLTQSGDGNPEGINNSPLVIGRTYRIDSDGVPSGIWDFTNVGAANNNIGTYFVATGTTPTSWGGPSIVLAYTNGAPVVTVLENTIGNVWFIYNSVGIYDINSNALFTENKMYLVINPTNNSDITGNSPQCAFIANSDSILQLSTQNGGDLNDGFLYNTPIEIRVYN